MEPTATGLDGLRALLPGRKGGYAVRWACEGGTPGPDRFARQGVALSAAEAGALAGWLERGLVTEVAERVRAADGAVRLVLRLQDGQQVETVAMPVGAACVSTQVGCAVGCRFCASGMFGLARNLSAEEIVEQVLHARRAMPIDRVVYMGMGEPTHNLEAVLEAVARVKDECLIGPRRQTLSTVGSLNAFARMAAAAVRPCLALSLHCADERRRRDLLPRAGKDPLRELVRAADDYGRAVRIPVQFEWTLLDGVNDSEQDADALVELLAGVRGYVNFIVWNRVDGLPFRAPPRERIVALVRRVKRQGVLATIRDSVGADAGAACGQLRLQGCPDARSFA